MPFEVFPTTAENIIGATDAALQTPTGVTDSLVAEFLDVPIESARNALLMASQLGLVSQSGAGRYVAANPFAAYLVTASIPSRAAVLRLMLEQYAPYRMFKSRLTLTQIAADAATQTRALCGIPAHREIILNTFISLGTFTNSLASEAAGQYRASGNAPEDYLAVLDQVIQNRETAEMHVRKRLGQEAANWIDAQQVMDHLVTAYQRAAQAAQDPRAPIVHAGNAVESFLVQVADHHNAGIQGATGINAKAERLANQHFLTTKHLNMMKYLGHVRNAAEHGTDLDPDVGHIWEVSPETSVEYVYVAQSSIRAVVAHIVGRFIV